MTRSAVLLHVNRRRPLRETHLKDDFLQDTGDSERRDVVVVVGERLLLGWDGPQLRVTEGGVRDQDHTLVGGGGVPSDRNYLFSHLVHKDLPGEGGEGRGGEGRGGEGRGGESILSDHFHMHLRTCIQLIPKGISYNYLQNVPPDCCGLPQAIHNTILCYIYMYTCL